MIMRYQRINSPSNPPNWKTYKQEEEESYTNSNWYMKSNNSTIEGGGISRFRSSPSKTTTTTPSLLPLQQDQNNSLETTTSTSNDQNVEEEEVANGGGGRGVIGGNGGGESFLQWGHRKRSRCSRSIITLADDTSSSTTHLQHSIKIQKRSSPNANLMPPPPPSTNGKPQNPRNHSSNPSPLRRNLQVQVQSGGENNRSISGRSRAVKRSPFLDNNKKNHHPPAVADAPCSSSSISVRDEKKINQEVVNTSDGINNFLSTPPLLQQPGCNKGEKLAAETAAVAATGGGGGGGKVNEWPRIYIPLSRKEKEEDFIQFKGTKLPHRPKKRPKAIDRVIQYCYPGMWLPELSKARYEVREKKSSKKQKRRGLKGMESMESDSE